MDLVTARLLEHLHGHLGWLTVAALVHPAILLRRGRRAPWSVGLACVLVSLSATLGFVLYPEYRARIRQHLFQEAPRIAWLFERKEHLAFGALALAWAGASAYVAGRRMAREDPDAARLFQRAARLAFTLSALLAALVAAFGVAVAVTRSF
jgi:predicted membrane-bound mannosyltransferase